MPRQKRLNVPGSVFHVMARGIERRVIFRDKADYQEFLFRLAQALEKSGSLCYAWVLMPNHFHLLVRSSDRPLSDLMRRLMTSYAGYFNRRHRWSGHLFQNRYKSILCQEDIYFLELVRYLHLNPVRAGLVKSLGELNRYPWSGHGVLAGAKENQWQRTGEVLCRFHTSKEVARGRYQEFVQDGWKMGRRPDLTGGGLQRSAGGWEGVTGVKAGKEFWRSDARILGDGEFVSDVLKASEETLAEKEQLRREGWTLEKILQRGCDAAGVKLPDILRKGRENGVSKAKSLISYWAVEKLGMSRRAVAGRLEISQQAVSEWFEKGRHLCEQESINLLSC